MGKDLLAALADDLKNVTDAEAYWDTCVQAFDSLGVTGIGYGVVPIASEAEVHGLDNATFFRHTYGREWERAVSQDGLLDEDVSTTQLLAGTEEIDWRLYGHELELNKVQKRRWELEESLGMLWGKSILLSHHSKNAVSSGVGLQVSAARTDEDFQKYWAEHRQQIRAIAELLDTGMLQHHPTGIVRLTGREKDYLYWAAMGLDRIETAQRLGISEHTLNKPIASAKAKLKARSTSQAVAKAVLLGLINL